MSFAGLGPLGRKEAAMSRVLLCESSPSHLSVPRQSCFLMLQCAGQGRRRKNSLKMQSLAQHPVFLVWNPVMWIWGVSSRRSCRSS